MKLENFRDEYDGRVSSLEQVVEAAITVDEDDELQDYARHLKQAIDEFKQLLQERDIELE